MGLRRLPFVLCLALAATASAQEPVELADGPDPDCVAEVHAALDAEGAASPDSSEPPDSSPGEDVRASPGMLAAPEVSPNTDGASHTVEIPHGRSIGALQRAVCLDTLRQSGVTFQELPSADIRGVGIPIRLQSTLGGVEVRSRSGSELHEVLDCRLAVALLAWAPSLRAEGVRRLLHYSTYRPGSRVARSGRVSGHAKGLAIDLAVMELEDGRTIDVLEGWEARERGRAPCEGEFEEGDGSAKLRRVVCGAAREDLFQVVLTPHYDRAHGNHVHLEVVPGVSWSFIH